VGERTIVGGHTRQNEGHAGQITRRARIWKGHAQQTGGRKLQNRGHARQITRHA
jgi:hypothetical protein